MRLTKILKTDIDWVAIKNECRTTVGKDGTDNVPSDDFKKKLLISEHSPMRMAHIVFAWDSIKSWIATHFARHWVGWEKWISTQRKDRTGVNRDKSPQDTLVRMHVQSNPMSLINVGRFRLCKQAADETREHMEDLKVTIHDEVDENISNVIVPNCIYRGGCSEFECCGEIGRFRKWLKDNNKELNWFNIQERYDRYNEWFYEERGRENE